jgi:hypothetical protein
MDFLKKIFTFFIFLLTISFSVLYAVFFRLFLPFSLFFFIFFHSFVLRFLSGGNGGEMGCFFGVVCGGFFLCFLCGGGGGFSAVFGVFLSFFWAVLRAVAASSAAEFGQAGLRSI